MLSFSTLFSWQAGQFCSVTGILIVYPKHPNFNVNLTLDSLSQIW